MQSRINTRRFIISSAVGRFSWEDQSCPPVCDYRDIEAAAEAFECENGESDNIEVGTLDPVNEQGGNALNGIGAGFVPVFVCTQIPLDLPTRQAAEMYPRCRMGGALPPRTAIENA